ncbi:unnamed protein product, partial [Mesorhabditis spiculigera]
MSSCEKEVKKIGSKLEKLIEAKQNDEALELLGVLAKQPITVLVLTNTRIGVTVNELRKKSSDEKFAKRAKALVKEWKSMFEGGDAKSSPKHDKPKEKEVVKSAPATTSAPTPTAPPVAKPPAEKASFSGNFPPDELAGDEIRIKACELLLTSLKCKPLPEGTHDPEELAIKIEAKLFDSNGKNSSEKYKAALRSRVFNLKKNDALRENVLTAVVSAEKFAVMTSNDMASDEVKKLREKFAQDAIRDAQVSVQQGTPSEMFKCGKCQKKNCTYTQLQTRSADEPMTTFVFCLECGNRWKFC